MTIDQDAIIRCHIVNIIKDSNFAVTLTGERATPSLELGAN